MKYENNGKQITTYVMLDNCSQGSFVRKAVLKELRVKGTNSYENLQPEDLS